ncbi:hypothetical protein [Adhaeribacter soli]|uniref:PA14 domain-containing protein n=1 Tax=Adhaeribacter soli TaxID=2607655 RepID=A0A5N1II10_9BACT|nr:hypothetical protein [Adhaeribacter soli]KAA9324909.1 hypothetical protein F0P94_19480 [Adhaeribacter soli]
MKNKLRIIRLTAFVLAINITLEAFFPVVAYALTSGPTTPEVYGHQPVDATDNVSLVTGDFNYTIPITSIPEYPMAIGYSSQAGMDQEAGIFGFGINGFTGAIARGMQGLPDDLKGGARNYKYENQPNWSASVEGTFSASLASFDVGVVGGGVGGNVSLLVGYDNYKGLHGAIGAGLGIAAGYSGNGSTGVLNNVLKNITVGIGGNVNSDYGFAVGGGLSFNNMVSLGMSGTSLKSLQPSLSFMGNDMIYDFNENAVSAFSGAPLSNELPPLANVIPTIKSFGASLTVPINPNIDVTGTYTNFDRGTMNSDKNGYGFLYLDEYGNQRGNRDIIADFAIEGEQSYNSGARNNPSYLQRDGFTVSAQGLSGGMQLYQDEYGVVSRNFSRYQDRDLSLKGLMTVRKEVEPWTNITKSSINKQLDILDFLKKSDQEGDKDFDKTIFIEKELKSLKTNDQIFNKPNGKLKFKMRGDLAGEFNLASSNATDFSPNKYDLIHLSGSGGDNRFFFLGEEADMPLYYPNPKQTTYNNFNRSSNKLKTSTQISYYTVKEVLDAHCNSTNCDPAIGGAKYNESFFIHEKLKNVGNKWEDPKLKDKDNYDNHNILDRLKIIQSKGNPENKFYPDNLIADVRVKNVEGLTYVFNLPVFNESSETIQLTGKGKNAPVKGSSTYHSFNQNGRNVDRNKITVKEKYAYPYAWMLTAIVGPDYIDFDKVPGPSDGDLGYWVKFKYVRVAENYKWRMPFSGLSHNPLTLSLVDDDTYSAVAGEKEVYTISEIESSGFISKFQYQKRFDGLDTKDGLLNGSAFNPFSQNAPNEDVIGEKSLFAVTRVELYKKHFEGENSKRRSQDQKRGKLIQATEFKYDYSICPKTPNNLTNYKNFNGNYDVKAQNVSYHINHISNPNAAIGTGKLTLRKVQQKSYEGDDQGVYLPSYQLRYGFDDNPGQPEYNPEYDAKQIDQWGNYSKESKFMGTNLSNVPFYHNYTEINKAQADKNARAFKVSKISMPTGGALSVAFEAKSYSKVQEHTPFIMRHIDSEIGITYGSSGGPNTLFVWVDISDLDEDGGKDLRNLSYDNGAKYSVGDEVYGELTFYESNTTLFPKREDEAYTTPGVFVLHELTNDFKVVNGRKYQKIKLKDKNKPAQIIPFVSEFKRYLFGSSTKMKVVKENSFIGPVNCNNLQRSLDQYNNLEKDGPLDAARKMINNAASYFRSSDNFETQYTDCYGSPWNEVSPNRSFIRTLVHKGKYTGSQVKSITFTDGFSYATSSNGTDKTIRENTYTTNYFYDVNGDGTGKTEGVATLEPGDGPGNVIDNDRKTGIGFMPAPNILYAKTSVETGYAALNSTNGSPVSRKKGKTEYQFFSPKDSEYSFDKNFVAEKTNFDYKPDGRFFLLGIWSWLILKIKIWPFKKKLTIKIPIPLPLKVRWRRADTYDVKSYAYADQTDIYGRLKKVRQLGANGIEVSMEEYKYFGKNEAVKAYNGVSSNGSPVNAFNTTPDDLKLGRTDQTWSEAYYTKESEITLIPWILFLNANTQRHFAYTNMKYTYVPPVLKETVTKYNKEGIVNSLENTAFDHYTGQPIETKTSDSYSNMKINRVVPAYWQYPIMGPASPNSSSDNLNMLTQATATYQYLNTVSVANVISAGITEWSTDGYLMVDGIRNTGKQEFTGSQPGQTEFAYAYSRITSNDLETVYQTNGKTRPNIPLVNESRGNDAVVKNRTIKAPSKVARPIRTFAYETKVKDNGADAGTYTQFSPFVYSSTPVQSNPKWKLLTTSTLFDLNGNVVETKDVLEKYTAAHFGYNFSNSVMKVSNASWHTSLFAGAENTYSSLGATPETFSDDPKLVLESARVVGKCDPVYANKVLTYSSMKNNVNMLRLCFPSTISTNLNTPVARVKVSYIGNNNATLQRSLLISLNNDKKPVIMTDRGEVFNGYYLLPDEAEDSYYNTCYTLIFDGSVLQNFTLDNTFQVPGFYSTVNAHTVGPNCSMPNKSYKLSVTDCILNSHTGNYVFSLEGNDKKGTLFELDFTSNKVPVSERTRKYKASVWVHKSSPAQTALVVQGWDTQLNRYVTIRSVAPSAAYMTAGDWMQLRVEVERNTSLYSKLRFFVENKSSLGTAIYDDFKVMPYQAVSKSFVYDHKTGRVMAELDNENIATFYKYDAKGRLIEVKAEVDQLGPQTIKRYLYNEQKGAN